MADRQNPKTPDLSQKHPPGPTAKVLTYCFHAGCERKAVARGMCIKHYHRAWNNDEFPKRPDQKPALVKEQVGVSPETDEKLRRLSRVTGKTVSEILREMIAAALKD